VLYSSGSSGRPKGVAHGAYGILFRAFQNVEGMAIRPGDRVLTGFGAESYPGFLLTVSCLVRGAAIILASPQADGIGAMLRLAAAEQASLMAVPTPMLGSVLAPDNAPAALASLRCIQLGGARLPWADFVGWRARLPATCAIFHSYGSTEVGRIADWVVPDDVGQVGVVVPAGRLRPGLEFAIVGDDGRPAADGGIGELILRGREIAVGEWRAGRMVAGRMQPDPAAPGTRVFRTGDLVRLGPDGLLHVAGRADRQVKINGFRIEPAEIEAVIRANPAVRDAVVLLTGSGGLHAFVVAPDADAEALRQALVARMREALPPPLRPRRVSVIASLPALPGGKVDVQTLRQWAQPAGKPDQA